MPEITRFFHPHGFTQDEAYRIANHTGQDIYSALFVNGIIKAYGMLRGWDEGYETPCLGICVDPSAARQGFGRMMMDHLHAMAKNRGARSVMLKVYKDNIAAINLYLHLGYEHAGSKDDQIVYIKYL